LQTQIIRIKLTTELEPPFEAGVVTVAA